ncbi:MAG: c-type cytochrome biogenesis protein CcmI, partial [Alphaproteobacteria bacterium]
VVPLFRKGAAALDRAGFDRAVFSDQLRELERDLERGVIGEADARAARTEIERRILSTAPGSADGTAHAPPAARPLRGSRALLVALVVLVPVTALGLYLVLGTPRLPGQPFAGRVQPGPTAEGPTTARIEAMVAMVERRLAEEPGEIEGWTILTTAYLRLGRQGDAEDALARALDLTAGDKPRAAVIAANYGEALVAMNGGRVVPRAKAAFARAHALAPRQPAARYYLGLARLQAGDGEGALETWRRLVAEAPADAPWLAGLKKRIAKITSRRGVNAGDPGPKSGR